MSRKLPLVEPQWSPRTLSAADVVRLVQGDDVPGVPPNHHCILALRRGLSGNLARVAFVEARRNGYLFLNAAHYNSIDEVTQLREVWAWWCYAAGHPEITLMTGRDIALARVHCDVSPTGNDWSFGAFAAIGKLVEPLASYQDGSWLFTTDELQLDGIEMDDAVHIARSLVDLATAGRFRPGAYDEGPAPVPRHARFPTPLTPTERSTG